MSFTRQMVVLDAADVERTAAFWTGFYGGVVVRSDEDWYEIQVGEELPMAIQLPRTMWRRNGLTANRSRSISTLRARAEGRRG